MNVGPPRPRAARRMLLVAAIAASLASSAPTVSGATLYGLIDTAELFSSVDNGATWVPVSTLPIHDARSLAARWTTTELFLASRAGGIYRSIDGGASWTPMGTVSASDVEDLAIRPDGALLVITATGSVYESVDLGASFVPLTAIAAGNVVSLTLTTPATRGYAMTRTGEVYESLDGGTTWTPKGTLAASNAVRLRAVGPTLYALTETGDVYESDDGAVHWTAVGTLSQVGMRGLTRNGTSLAAATREGHVATSADGASWTWRGSMNQLSLTALASNEPATTDVAPGGPRASIALGPIYPNPSQGPMSFILRLDRPSQVRMTLHDVSGRRVASRGPEPVGSGGSVVTWRPGGLAPGVHLLRLETEAGLAATRRWVVMR